MQSTATRTLRLAQVETIFLHRRNLPIPRRAAIGATLFHTMENWRRFGAFTGTRQRRYFINLRVGNG